mgnify:CR=1 FL=1|tara:strand:+ start:13940 stop:15478 length:1539 start_codon:yes stop_codon:yes gene_type:complete
MKILSAEQLYNADSSTIKNQKLNSLDLMERAAQECFNWLHGNLGGSPVPLHIFCGIGNNGGDGLAIGRMLVQHGYQVYIYVANFTDVRSPNFLKNYDIFKEIGKEWPILMSSKEDFPVINENDIIVDALFGIGLNRPPEGWVNELITYINTSKAYKVSIDIPSGLYPNKKVNEPDSVLKADYTLTFQTPKLAFFLPETNLYTRAFTVLDIGLDKDYINKVNPLATTFGKYEAQKTYRPRNKNDHKGDFGYSLIVGGSYGKIGAIVLATKAALKVGAGVMTAFIPKCGYTIMQTALPEAMVVADSSDELITKINLDFQPNAIGIGPGMGTNKLSTKALEVFMAECNAPLVIDADALNCISENKTLLKLIPEKSILTPHPGELKRLIGDWTDDYHKIELTKNFSKKLQVIVLIKGAHTLIINDNDVYVNTTGNPGMATAGSGDVLTGMITGLLSQKYKPLEAALFGTYLHGAAGDIAASNLGFEAVTASDIINEIGESYLDLFAVEDLPKKEEV